MFQNELLMRPPSSIALLMLRQLSKWLVVGALVLATGGHWALLQSVAWVGMAIHFAHTDGFSVALQKTFDGKHPCKMCKVVEAGRKAAPEQELQKLEVKMDFFCVERSSFLVPAMNFPMVSPSPEMMLPRTEAPPLPPPRLA
jgi:hypothetical protein